jgi:hypothetical protein
MAATRQVLRSGATDASRRFRNTQKERKLQRLTYPLDTSRRFEVRWKARFEASGASATARAAGSDMKARDRIDRVRRVLEARWVKRGVRGSLALARRREAEGVEQRQHSRKPKPSANKAPDEPSVNGDKLNGAS